MNLNSKRRIFYWIWTIENDINKFFTLEIQMWYWCTWNLIILIHDQAIIHWKFDPLLSRRKILIWKIASIHSNIHFALSSIVNAQNDGFSICFTISFLFWAMHTLKSEKKWCIWDAIFIVYDALALVLSVCINFETIQFHEQQWIIQFNIKYVCHSDGWLNGFKCDHSKHLSLHARRVRMMLFSTSCFYVNFEQPSYIHLKRNLHINVSSLRCHID